MEKHNKKPDLGDDLYAVLKNTLLSVLRNVTSSMILHFDSNA